MLQLVSSIVVEFSKSFPALCEMRSMVLRGFALLSLSWRGFERARMSVSMSLSLLQCLSSTHESSAA